MDLGFRGDFDFLGNTYHRLPFDVVWANDFNKYACKTYRKNLSEHIICGDVFDNFDSLPDYADVVIGGFPCQDFSTAGRREGLAGGRGFLFRAIEETLRRVKPRIFVAENVPGLLHKTHKDALELIMSAFCSVGYNVQYKVLKAAGFGVPQRRERVFFVGVSNAEDSEFTYPDPVLDPENWITAKQALQDLETLERDAAINHIWSVTAYVPTSWTKGLKADMTPPTLLANSHGQAPFHYLLPRRISIRESARLQSFPDGFIFDSKLRNSEIQVGNAVPPVLAWHIAKSVQDFLQKSQPTT